MLLSRGFLLVLCTAGIVTGFRPNHATVGVPPTDYTDADITEMGVLQAVAWYMERNPAQGKPPIDPESIKPLTASKLFKAYFQANVSASRFEKAIQEIIDGNNQVELYHKEDSSFFFYCEEIAQSINQLQLQRDSALSSLKQSANSSNLESARLKVGKALHVLQKFYSNTNWIEMGETEPYKRLVDADSNALRTAPAGKKTCNDCRKGRNGQYSCLGNIVVRGLLTSGYKISATCQSKPKGKCGHGGKDDVNEDRPPTGGINKETSNPLLSPHHHYHTEAAELAIQATQDFFVGDGPNFLQEVGRDIFRKFFNLEGYSLTFVIDTTGSMEDDIEQVKTTCIEILRRQASSPDAPYDYILVPFNDPAVGPVLKTHDVNQFKSFIGHLKADGGDDCPEMSMTGLKKALQESMPRSKIFVFTDAGAKDESLKDEVKVLIDSSQSEVNYALTGSCSSRKRRSIAETSANNPYSEIADYSGGYYVMTTKSELSQILGIVELSLNAAPVKVAHTRTYGTRFTFPVDETLSELTVSVKSLGSPRFSITVWQPSGKRAASPQTIISTENHKVIKVSPVVQWGEWAVTMSPVGAYEVDIGGKSLLDFIYQIMEEQEGLALPIQGHPGRGTNYTVSLKLLGESEGAQVQRLVFLSTQKTIMDSVPLNQTTDTLGNIVANAQVSFQAQTTQLGVEGLSPGGLPFSRINTNAVNSASVRMVPLKGQNATVTPGGLLEVSVLVVNDGPDAMFYFTVRDDWHFLQTFQPKEHFLSQGGNITLTATFEAAVAQDSFASSTATFTAKSSSAQNYLKLPITVTPETALETDTEPPVLKNLKYSTACEHQYSWHSYCSQRHWHLRFSAEDDHSSVTVQINEEQEEEQEQEKELSYRSCEKIKGDDRRVFCRYGGLCCFPYLELLVSDGNGNAAIVPLDARTPPRSVV